MCGLTGAVALNGEPLDPGALKQMVDVIAHRGPDDAGYMVWQSGRSHSRGTSHGQAFTDRTFQHLSPLLPAIDSTAGRERLMGEPWDVMIGHRRLAVIDLSPTAHQPMSDVSQRIWLAYNGEIYNFRELRQELQSAGFAFKSHSDTEVLLYAYEHWGAECIHRLNGMFAFVIWDARSRKLLFARDRYGIKPLYYCVNNRQLVFGSEVKSILRMPGVAPQVDLLALNEYFSFQNILSDRSLFSDIRILPPGHYLEVSLETPHVSPTQYWDFEFTGDSTQSEDELRDEIAESIRSAVTRQCVSDVPVGSYLSGGMDSATVSALASQELGRICTFTGGFDLSEAAEHEQSFDEREAAEHMANAFQTEHYECVLHSGDMEQVMQKLVWHLEDLRVGQCYPNYYVSRLASKFVTVTLTGTGGDELFGGYPWRYAAAVGGTHEDYVQSYYRYWKRLVRNSDKPRLFTADVAASLSQLRDAHGAEPFKNHTLSVFRSVLGHEVPRHNLSDQVAGALYFECKTFLHGLLVVEDKLSMAHSLETRVPFLDNDLVDLACRIPPRLKVSGIDHLEQMDENLPRKKATYRQRMHTGKNILRNAMQSLLPESVTMAKKQGFSAPDESWFRGRSQDYVQGTLLSSTSRLHEYLSPAHIAEILQEHSDGSRNHRLLIWSLLCFETWLQQFMGIASGDQSSGSP